METQKATITVCLFQNPTNAVKVVAEFLQKDMSTEVMEHIAENCSFDKLKTANATVKKRSESIAKRIDKASDPGKKPLGPPDMYRKGKHTWPVI